MVKTKTPLDQTWLNSVKQTPYLDIESEIEEKTKAEILKAKAVVIVDPLTGRALGAADFFFEHQDDAYLSQINPVSNTLYTVLDTTRNARIISLHSKVTWAVTQPTNMDIVCTVDGQTLVFNSATPISGSNYIASIFPWLAADANSTFIASGAFSDNTKAFLFEGRSVRVQIRVTWAVTQPTPLVCRVKYAKR